MCSQSYDSHVNRRAGMLALIHTQSEHTHHTCSSRTHTHALNVGFLWIGMKSRINCYKCLMSHHQRGAYVFHSSEPKICKFPHLLLSVSHRCRSIVLSCWRRHSTVVRLTHMGRNWFFPFLIYVVHAFPIIIIGRVYKFWMSVPVMSSVIVSNNFSRMRFIIGDDNNNAYVLKRRTKKKKSVHMLYHRIDVHRLLSRTHAIYAPECRVRAIWIGWLNAFARSKMYIIL